MRPDEEANRAEIQRDKKTRSNIAKGVGTAATLAVGGASARVLPFLSRFIPTDLAMKGLSKVAPKLSDFLKRGQSMGLNVEEGIQYIRDSMEPKKEPPKEDRNIIEQYSPELHQFIDQQIRGGRKPIEAAAIAQNDKRFSSVINKLSKDHNTPWSSIIDSVYGMGERAAASNPKQEALNKWNERQKKQSFLEEERERFERGYGNQMAQQGQQSQGGQPGPGQQALMAILNKINQKLGQ